MLHKTTKSLLKYRLTMVYYQIISAIRIINGGGSPAKKREYVGDLSARSPAYSHFLAGDLPTLTNLVAEITNYQ